MAQQSKGIKYELVAESKSFIKASDQHSASLSESEKIEILAGDIILSTIERETPRYWEISNALLNGKEIPDHIKYVLKAHWSTKPTIFESPDAEPTFANAHKLHRSGLNIKKISAVIGVPLKKVRSWIRTPSKS